MLIKIFMQLTVVEPVMQWWLLDEEEEEFIRSGAGQSRRQPQAFLNMGGGAGECTSRTNAYGRICKI